MAGLLFDLRFAVRTLLRTPGITLGALITLALGTGANVAMFSVVYGVLLRPLPYHDAGRLILPRADVQYEGSRRPVPVLLQATQFEHWRPPIDAIDGVAFFANEVAALSSTGMATEVLPSAVVSSEFFDLMGGPIEAGRPLSPGDDRTPSTVISDRLARRLFDRPDLAIGKSVVLTSQTYTVVGVASRSFQFPAADVDAWQPAGFVRSVSPRCCTFRVIARLSADGTLDRARASADRLFKSTAGTGVRADQMSTTAVVLGDELVAPVRPALLILFAAVLMVLMIACGNLVNLLLARNAARAREFAVRRALGATTSRLTRQLIVEASLIAAMGTAGGLALARASLGLLSRSLGAMPRGDGIQIDSSVLLFAGALAAIAALATGLLPALRATNIAAVTSQGSLTTTTPGRTRQLQRIMCVAQVALALILLTGATLFGRSLVRLLNVDLGVSTDHVLTASLNLAFGGRRPDADTLLRVNRAIEHVSTLPGVRSVGVGTSLPPAASRIQLTMRRRSDTVDYMAAGVPATPGYFSALQMRLVKGRLFTDADDAQHPDVFILTEATARRLFGSDDPIGQTMTLPILRDGKRMSAEMTLVGIIANVRYSGLGAPPDDAVFRPFGQQVWPAPFLVVRTAGDPSEFASTLRRAISGIDPAIVMASVTPLDQLVTEAAAQPQFRTILLCAFAALALGISAIGLYSLIAYTVSQRTREIGIRIAIGASSRDVLAMVLREGLVVAAIGVVVGAAGALGLSRLVSELLFGIAPADPASFVIAAGALLSLAAVASYVPARRAAHTDAIRALRTE